jgi:hypothetical protein
MVVVVVLLADGGQHLGQLGLVLGTRDRELRGLARQPPDHVVGRQVQGRLDLPV